MKIQWRNKEYEFTPLVHKAKKDKEGARAKTTIDKNIYAFDTESVDTGERYEPQTIQISSANGEDLLYLPPKCNSLEIFIDFFIKKYSYIEFENHDCFMYAHNLVYDWLQLIKNYPDLLAMARTGVGLNEDYTIYKKEYEVILKKNGLFTGTAPFFDICVKMSKREYVNILFRDTFSFFPSSLNNLAKDLKLEVNKMERQTDLGKRDYRLEESNPDKSEFEEYAKLDAKITRLAGEKIRELHQHAGMKRLRVSAPSFAINYLYHSIPDGTTILTGSSDIEVMQLVLDAYAGGRTGGIYHGKVNNISVLDFHSSYPASMLTLPSFSESMQYIRYAEPEKLTESELLEIIDSCHCFLKIDGVETDSKYPALITSIKNKLVPVYGEFKNTATTGVELSVGIKSGTLKVNKIHELICLVEIEEENNILPFKEFATSAYNRKANAEKGSVEYTSAKLVLNSSYGKLIEARSETPIYDDVRDLILPYVEGQEQEFGHLYYSEYIKTLNNESEETFDKKVDEIVETIMGTYSDTELSFATLEYLSLTKLTYGRYAIPAGASLITATSRARLLATMKITKALYWDTDSVFIKDFIESDLQQKLDIASHWLPAFIQPLKLGEEIGDLDCEIKNASGYLAGVKRYYLSNDEGKIKRALHGIPTAPYHEAKQMIEKLATGQENKYLGRMKPLSAKEAKTADEVGKFTNKEYVSQFNLDTRLNWTETENGWEGDIKNLECFT